MTHRSSRCVEKRCAEGINASMSISYARGQISPVFLPSVAASPLASPALHPCKIESKVRLMAVPPAPPPLEQLGPRPFSFYPPIGNIAHNEWLYQRATWSEVLVRNTKTAAEIWVPRRLVGEISRVDEPVMIVGLTKEMEYRGGALWPVVRRVIAIPLAVTEH